MLLILVTVIFIISTVFGQGIDGGGCVSLSTSKTCSAFSQFYIGLPGLGRDYPFLLNTTTIEEFDQRLLDYVNSTSSYLFPMGCLSSNFNPTIPYARYSLTKLCASLIQNPSYSLPCNFDNELQPPPLCQKTCYQWVDSVTHITNNPNVCVPSALRNSTLDAYNDQCKTWEGFNGTITENCISGIANEPYTCGFGRADIKIACHYCKNHGDDMCCQNLSGCSSSLSAGAIVGIVIGCIVFLALALFACICICQRKRNRPLNPFLFMSNSTSSATTATGQQTNLSKEYNRNIIDEPIIITTPLDTVNKRISIRSPDTKLQVESDFSNTIIPTTTQTPSNDDFYVVVHPYPPQMPDELELNSGDIICLALNFDDGWALGFNVTSGLKGAFPLVCISPAPEDCLDQLLNMPTIETDTHSDNDNIQRSLSLNSYNNNASSNIHHSNTNHQHHTITNNHTTTNTNINTNTNPTLDTTTTIPKRSIHYKPSYDYMEAESPSSPTLHTPFFDSPAQPAPAPTLTPPPPSSLSMTTEQTK